jgi:prolyl-tRNA synthetase
MLRMSTLFLRTLRDDPADAEVASHRLLVRAGYIRRIAAGIYSWLPLGYLTFRNIERVIREEMDAAGFQEVHFPALLPREAYEETNRWTEYGPDLFRLKDRRGADYLLGPTHEEMFTLMVKGEYSSYKDLPLSLYQIQTKYRDEPRPRSGIIRGREFVMKDSYSFDLTDEGLNESYNKHRAAYIKTFDRLGMQYNIVSAMSGAMGGSRSEEFLAPCPTGEDTYVLCEKCGYAANVEAMKTVIAAGDPSGVPAMEVVDTPNTPTIDSLVAVLNERYGGGFTGADTLKNVLLVADGKNISVLVPGDREVDLKRLQANLPGVQDLRLFEDADFAKNPALVKGYVGPQNAKSFGLTLYADPRIAPGTKWVTGANKAGFHALNVVNGRDFEVDEYVESA